MEKIKKLIAAIKSKDFFRSLQSPTTTKIDLNCLDCKVDLMDDSGYLAFGICSACGHKDTLSAKQWVNMLFDKESFDEKFLNIESPDPLHFNDQKAYKDRIKMAKESTGEQAAVSTGLTEIKGIKVIAAIFDFKFMGGSMGYAVGEKITSAIDKSISMKLPLIVVTCSGGARMQEGTLALAQMIKTTNAINKLHAVNLPMICILANPTTGGVYASFANQADILIAEKEALIGFAGPRVRAVNTDEQDRLLAEEIYHNGLIDEILSRQDMRNYLERVLNLISPNQIEISSDQLIPQATESENKSSGWDSVQKSRDINRPSSKEYIDNIFSDFIELRGDRTGVDDKVLIGGFAKLALKNVMVIAQDRNAGTSDITRGRVSAAGYRKATRLINLANRLRLPIICFVDTPGANDSIENEKIGLAKAISDTIASLSQVTVETVSLIIGEGGSGGAIALCCTDKVLMQENAFLAITSPEGAASILYRDKKYTEDIANALGITASDHKSLGFVDEIIAEPNNEATRNHKEAARLLFNALTNSLINLQKINVQKRMQARNDKWENLGKNNKFSGRIQRLFLGITRNIRI
jgi:acyl-CoA carboxylase subunit beta